MDLLHFFILPGFLFIYSTVVSSSRRDQMLTLHHEAGQGTMSSVSSRSCVRNILVVCMWNCFPAFSFCVGFSDSRAKLSGFCFTSVFSALVGTLQPFCLLGPWKRRRTGAVLGRWGGAPAACRRLPPGAPFPARSRGFGPAEALRAPPFGAAAAASPGAPSAAPRSRLAVPGR